MFKRAIAAVAVLACVLAATSYLSPRWTIHRMRSAIASRDYKAFSSDVDFPSLRDSFRGQMTAAVSGQMGGSNGDGSALNALGQGIVASLANPLLDIVVTPAGVIEMMNAGVPKITPAVVTSAITRVPGAAESVPGMQVSYQGWDKVRFHRTGSPQNAGSFILRRQGLWSWKLAAVELPE